MILGLIPSRLNSTRLKEKPLLMIDGLPIIVHTFKRAQLSKKLDEVIVCTDHQKIVDVVRSNGGKVVLTSKKHENGTERIYEVAKKKKAELIIDIQGDEPLVDPKDIDKVIDFHRKNKHFDIVIPSMQVKENINSKNLVKVIFSDNGKIIYFSRARTPHDFKEKGIKYFKQLSVVSFHPGALKKYSQMKMGKIEKIESVELLRAIENNLNIGTYVVQGSSFAVDVNQDLMRAIEAMSKDRIRKLY